ncbi:DUF1275 domain-containing protein [Methylobacterium radiodurans]|uniref:DUF1275 domain-containing protein n=1 Tax=Methylobacterium radiodurans TaxID=2202828 RepID=UPI0013A555DD|nr:DUF1275 domain-containing protein [Methylobacterium radiodurans]
MLAFGIGSAVCGLLMTSMLRIGKVFNPAILLAICVMLIGLGLIARSGILELQYIAYGISFIAGVQRDAFHKVRGMLFGAVAVTSVVQIAFNFVAQSLFSTTGPKGKLNMSWAAIFFLTLLSFAGCGDIGYVSDQQFAGAAIFMPTAFALVIGLIALGEPRKLDPGPTSGSLIA